MAPAQSYDAESQQRGVTQPQQSLGFIALIFTLGCLYISCSAGMIAFNKYLMQPGRFPYPVYLVSIHTSSGFLLAGLVRIIRPSMFPSLEGQETHMPVTKTLIVNGAVPISFLAVLYLVLSNWAYMHSSVAFLQMMKESNVALVFCFAAAIGVEVFTWQRSRLICVILLATVLTIRGEVHFSWLGFSIQGSSQVFESIRIVLQGMLLSTAGKKLDALSYTFITMPIAFGFLSVLLAANATAGNTYFPAPRWEDIQAWWPVLLANLSLAFSLNIVVAFFMQNTSAVGIVLAGIVKDAAIVLVGCLLLGESLSHVQMLGFAMQLAAICTWSLSKMFPAEFEMGIFAGLYRCTIRAAAKYLSKSNNTDEDLVVYRLDQAKGEAESHEFERLIKKTDAAKSK